MITTKQQQYQQQKPSVIFAYLALYISNYALVITRCQVQYGKYFLWFSYFCDSFHEPLGE